MPEEADNLRDEAERLRARPHERHCSQVSRHTARRRVRHRSPGPPVPVYFP